MWYDVLSDLFSYFAVADGFISKDASTPLVVVVPGLTSDSAAAVSFYIFSDVDLFLYCIFIFEELFVFLLYNLFLYLLVILKM